jgi:hypothetical protein
MDALLRDISSSAAEATVRIGEEETKTGLKKQFEKAKAGARKVAHTVLEHVALTTQPLKHSEHAPFRRLATKIEEVKESNKTKLAESEASAARQTLKGTLLRHARKVSSGIAAGATAARVLISPTAFEVGGDLTPSARGVEFATQAVVATARASKDAGELLAELTAAAVDARSRVSTGLHRATESFSSAFGSPALFSPSSASSQSIFSPSDNESDAAPPTISMKDFLSPVSPSVAATPNLAAREGMLTRYLRSKASSQTRSEASDAVQERALEEAKDFFEELEARLGDSETVSAVRTLAEHHLSKAGEAIAAGATNLAHRFSAFVHKA